MTRSVKSLLAVVAVLGAVATVVAISGTSGAAGRSLPAACATTAQTELAAIVRRVYDQALSGRNETSAVRRIDDSGALARAVAGGHASTVSKTLAKLIKSQITRIAISTSNGTIVRMGTIPSYGPVSGTISYRGQTVGHYVLSVASNTSFEALVHDLTGGRAKFVHGGGRASGSSGPSFAATRFPAGAATIALSLPTPPASVCAATPADTQLQTIGLVARNLLDQEVHSREMTATLRYVEGNAAFVKAVAAGNAAGVKRAIDGFFGFARFHIVRVRAWKGSRLINDVGGPFVLSPAPGVLRGPSGKVVGHFVLAIQDDLGYIKLVHEFTGVDVVLHANRATVPGSTLRPGPAFASGLGTTTYNGRTYRAFGLTGTVFPTGTLQVSLLAPN
jgi:hypothetical protein